MTLEERALLAAIATALVPLVELEDPTIADILVQAVVDVANQGKSAVN